MKVLLSYWFFRKRDMAELFARLRSLAGDELKVMIDSGAFSALTQNHVIDVAEYAEWVAPLRKWIDVYINLDVIGDAVGTQRNQDALEAAGLRPLPVFHFGSPWPAFDALVERYDYIGLGGMVGKPPSRVYRWAIECFQRTRGKGIRFHGLGQTHRKQMELPWYSLDSSSWMGGYRYGQSMVYDPTTGGMRKVITGRRANVPELYRLAPWLRDVGIEPGDLINAHRKDSSAVSIMSFLEWERNLQRRHRRSMGAAWDGRPLIYLASTPTTGGLDYVEETWPRWHAARGSDDAPRRWSPLVIKTGGKR